MPTLVAQNEFQSKSDKKIPAKIDFQTALPPITDNANPYYQGLFLVPHLQRIDSEAVDQNRLSLYLKSRNGVKMLLNQSSLEG